ncbi:MAG: hypothetical protein OWQ48_00245 [Desulfurococcus sp.]|nr:hypothetical protein [Desulfurococcus sp.]
MTLIASSLAEKAVAGFSERILEGAERRVAEILVPRRVTRGVVEKYIRKAIANRSWYTLPRVTRILLLLVRRLPRVKSPVLTGILREIFLKVELASLKGRAILYGILVALGGRLTEILGNVKRLLTLGLFYLNQPVHYRIYG